MLKRLPYAIRDVFVPFCLVVLPFTVPVFSVSFDASTFLSVVSLLFAILAGFFFAAATSNYLRMQTLISNDNAGLVTLYRIAKIVDASRAENVAEAIDTYLMSDLDFDLLNAGMKTSREREAIMTAVDALTPTDESGRALFGLVHSRKEEMRSVLSEYNVTARTIIGRDHWTVLILLACILTFLSYCLRDGGILSSAIVVAASVAIYLALRLLHAIDTNLFLAKKLAFQDPQEVFVGIGRLPYYPAYAVRRGQVPKQSSAYRVGKKLPDGAREIHIMTP
jgi:hypothetical protein